MSNWCNPKKWFRDSLLTRPNNSIPKNEINDITVNKNIYNFLVNQNTCFQKIPYLEVYNLNILNDGDTRPPPQRRFTCEILSASHVNVDTNLTLEHWEQDTYCTYEVSSIALSSGTRINKIICQTSSTSGTGFFAPMSTIDGSVIIADSVYLGPGSTIIDSNNTFLTQIITENGIFSGVNVNSPDTTLNGEFKILNNSVINCTGIGDFLFDDSKVGNDGHIQGNAILQNKSINNGNIFGNNIIFSGSGTSNLGLVSGNCIFIFGATNSGNISGSAVFKGPGSTNYGLVNNESHFYENSINEGKINGLSIFYDSVNKGKLNNGAKFYNSINDSGIINSGEVLFNNSQNNTIVSGSIVSFISGSINNSNGIVYANNIIFKSGINAGNVYADSGYILFQNNSSSSGYCRAAGIDFKDFCHNTNIGRLDSISGSIFNFYDKSLNDASINIKTINSQLNFNNNAINSGRLSISGSGSSINFYNNAINLNYINFVNFYNNSINSGAINTGLFYNTSINSASGTDLYFCNRSINLSGGRPISCTFRDHSINSGAMEKSFFFNNSQNSPPSSVNLSIESGNFFDSSKNNTYGKFNSAVNFYNNSVNLALNTVPHFFYHRSVNEGRCIGTAQFSNNSRNKNYVNNGIFLNSSINEKSGSGYTLSFNDYSRNNGYSINASFGGSSINGPLAYCSFVIFGDSSINYSSFAVNNKPSLSGTNLYNYPNIEFIDNSTNFGAIVESLVSFKHNSSNIASVRFGTNYVFENNRIFKKAIENNKIILTALTNENIEADTNKFLDIFFGCGDNGPWPTISFQDNSKNLGNIEGYFKYYFSDNSENHGTLLCFSVVSELHDMAYFNASKNFGDISKGKSYFLNNAINSGNALCQSFINSINYGELIFCLSNNYSGSCITLNGFDHINFNGSINSGQCLTSALFIDSKNYGNIQGSGSFVRSVNNAFVRDQTIFNNSINSGSIGSDAVFLSNSSNYGTIRGSATFDELSCTGVGSLIYGNIVSPNPISGCS